MCYVNKDKIELLKLSEVNAIVDIYWCEECNGMIVSCSISYYGYYKFLADDLKNATYISQLIRSLNEYGKTDELSTIKVDYIKNYLDIDRLAIEEAKRRKEHNNHLEKLKQEEINFYKKKLNSLIREK